MQKSKPKDKIVEDKATGLLLIYEPAPEKVPPKPNKFQKKLEKAVEEKKWFEGLDFDGY